jgi:hypothetical protein
MYAILLDTRDPNLLLNRVLEIEKGHPKWPPGLRKKFLEVAHSGHRLILHALMFMALYIDFISWWPLFMGDEEAIDAATGASAPKRGWVANTDGFRTWMREYVLPFGAAILNRPWNREECREYSAPECRDSAIMRQATKETFRILYCPQLTEYIRARQHRSRDAYATSLAAGSSGALREFEAQNLYELVGEQLERLIREVRFAYVNVVPGVQPDGTPRPPAWYREQDQGTKRTLSTLMAPFSVGTGCRAPALLRGHAGISLRGSGPDGTVAHITPENAKLPETPAPLPIQALPPGKPKVFC